MRLRLTKRLWWRALAVFGILLFGFGIFVWDRHRQRAILEEAGLEILVEDAMIYSLPDPVVEFLEDNLGMDEPVERFLQLFGDNYEITGQDGERPIDSKKLRHLKGWPAAKALELYLELPDFSDDDFRKTGAMPELKSLYLMSAELTDEIVPAIVKQTPDLQCLYLGESPSFHGTHLDQLRFFKGATDSSIEFELGLIDVPVGDDAIGRIVRHAPGITSLYLINTSLSDAGVEHLQEFKTLSVLNISGSKTQNSGRNYDRFAGMKSLRSLQLEDGPPEGIRRLLSTSMPHLKGLTLRGVPLSTSDVEKIHPFAPNLEWLDLYSTGIGNEAVDCLVSFTGLKHLYLSGNLKITDSAEPFLKRIPPATKIYLHGTGVSPAAKERIKRR